MPILKEEVIMERQAAVSARNRLESLKKEIASTESEMKQLQDSMDTLIRMQERFVLHFVVIKFIHYREQDLDRIRDSF